MDAPHRGGASVSHAATVERLANAANVSPLDVLEFFLERAAIREYQGGMPRDQAEALAVQDAEIWIELKRRMP